MTHHDTLTQALEQIAMAADAPAVQHAGTGAGERQPPDVLQGREDARVPAPAGLEKIERCTPGDIDTAKAWTCAAHIVSTGGDVMNEGFLLRVDDRMFWGNVHANLTQEA